MINRQKLIEELNNCHFTIIGMPCGKTLVGNIIQEYHDHVIEVIESQPPADVPDTNDGKWIPCSERLPKESNAYEVTIINSNNERFTMPLYYSEEYKAWATRNNVIAWRERLEPYKGAE